VTTRLWLSMLAPTFKHAQYDSEREWRLISMITRTEAKQRPSPVVHRLRDGEDVPYVPRALGKTPTMTLTLTRVLCGARVSEGTVAAVKRLVKGRMPGCSVEKSRIEVPWRHAR
jgi:hypothetical protein